MKQTASTGAFRGFRKTFIGDRKFYITVFTLLLPLIIQNAISHFVNLLDNLCHRFMLEHFVKWEKPCSQ